MDKVANINSRIYVFSSIDIEAVDSLAEFVVDMRRLWNYSTHSLQKKDQNAKPFTIFQQNHPQISLLTYVAYFSMEVMLVNKALAIYSGQKKENTSYET